MLSLLVARLSRTAPDLLRVSLARARNASSSILPAFSLLHARRTLSTTARVAAETTSAAQKPAKATGTKKAGTKKAGTRKAGTKAKPKSKAKATAKARKASATKKAKAKTKAKPKTKRKRKPKPKAKPKVVKKKVPKKDQPVRLSRADKPPKRPSGPFILFVQDQFTSEALASQESMTSKAIEAGRLWKELSQDQKDTYMKRAKELSVQYKAEIYSYYERTPKKIINEINRRRTKKGKRSLRPHKLPEKRRPTSSFLRFYHDHRRTLESPISVLKASRAAADKWHIMSVEEKEPYVNAANASWDQWRAKKAPATESNS